MPSNTLLFLSRTVHPSILRTGIWEWDAGAAVRSREPAAPAGGPGACLPSSLYRLHQDVHLKVNRKKGTHAVLADTTTAPPTMFFFCLVDPNGKSNRGAQRHA